VNTVHTGPHRGPLVGLAGLLALLAALTWFLGLSGSGWLAGSACGIVAAAALARGLARHRAESLGPADWVTLTRGVLVGGVAALTVDSFAPPAPVAALVALSTAALVLDGVDGWVARRTGTASALGARFDMEVDAFLIVVLSIFVARSAGVWVLGIGAARYVFLAAGWLLPWLRGPLPVRFWPKVVAAIQGIVLTVAAADVLPRPVATAALAAALGLLAQSFGRSVRTLWLQRPTERVHPVLRVGARDG
jgi:phosphatidylglycerophosphate synthase